MLVEPIHMGQAWKKARRPVGRAGAQGNDRIDMTPSHSSDEIAAFLGDGETRLIAAAYRDPNHAGELFVLPDGQAQELRVWTKAKLRCFFADCEHPDLTTVARSRARDGFKHPSGGGGHAPESIHHIQGKAIVAEWLRNRYSRSVVVVEAAIDTQRTRVPDIMITAPTGERVAFEIQYANLTVSEWRARHDAMRAAGIVDVWLFGHHGRQLRRPRADAQADVALNLVHEAVAAAGLPLLWINPELGRVGIGFTSRAVSRERLPVPARQGAASLKVFPLDELRVNSDGVRSPLLDLLHLNAVAASAAAATERLRYAAEEAARRAQPVKSPSYGRRWTPRTRRPQEPVIDHQLIAAERAKRKRIRRAAAGKQILCERCWWPLDPLLAETGMHPDCLPAS